MRTRQARFAPFVSLQAAAVAGIFLSAPLRRICETRALNQPIRAVGTPGAATLTLQPWLTEYDSNAVCNDGSPAGCGHLCTRLRPSAIASIGAHASWR